LWTAIAILYRGGSMHRVLLLTLLLPACVGDPGPAPLTFDPCSTIVLVPASDATTEERQSIDMAVAAWRARAGVALTTEDVPGAPRVGVLFRPASLAFFGIYERETVVINRELTDMDARAVVVAHELGHAFGLAHVEDRTSVMLPGNLTIPPGAVDEAALSALWGACPR
jgi:hypothetical protein